MAREAGCYDLLEAANHNNLMNNILFSDEATFHTCGLVNRHNCRIWAHEQPNATFEWQRDTLKINVWLGFTQTKVHGQFFFAEKRITAISYLDMLEQFLEPQLMDNGIFRTVLSQRDGATPHFAISVRDYLNEVFPCRWIGRGSKMWPVRSLDLTPLRLGIYQIPSVPGKR